MKRRKFLRIASAGLGLLHIQGLAQPFGSAIGSTRGPVAVGTWEHSREAIREAAILLSKGACALDTAEKAVNITENDPDVLSVGYGGLPNEDGIVQLDAAIMDGGTLRCGAVAALERIKNPISVARKVMETTRHIILVGQGALDFAKANGFRDENLLTDRARQRWLKWKRELNESDNWLPVDDYHDTIGLIALDKKNNIATAVTTSGLAWKIPGRIGDSPIIGAGSYCDNEVGAAVATGVGEEVIRISGCFLVVELMRNGLHPQRACEEALRRIIKANGDRTIDFQDAFLAVRKDGEIGAASLRKTFSYYLWKDGKQVLKEAVALIKGAG